MRRNKIVSSDATRQKIAEALKKRSSTTDNSQAQQSIIASRNNIKKNTINQQKVATSRIQRPGKIIFRRPTTHNLTTVNNKTIKLNLPEKGSFNGGIIDLGDKYLLVYRPDEIQLTACFMDYEYNIIPDSYNRFSLLFVADPRLILTPDNKVLMSYSKYSPHNMNEHIDGNIIMDLNNSTDKIFLGESIRISPPHLTGRQKNWMPFTHDEKLYFIATVCPHHVYEVDWHGKKESTPMWNTVWKNNWYLKESLRGNTNAIRLDDGNYLCTFHTAQRIDKCHFYDNGAYIFEGKPPFKPIFAGSRTYLRAESAKESHYRKEGLIICTFPIGMTKKDSKIIISYGDNDSCVKIMETNLEEIQKTMVEVKY
jgi:predicted GH43/DUF377 family glycosyl hydrolase